MLLLAITGIIYLFKADYNDARYQTVRFINTPINATEKRPQRASYQAQLDSVAQHYPHPIMQVFLPEEKNRTTGFRLHGKGHTRNMVYTNPYTGEITGAIEQKQTLMYSVRKLHGELLLSTPGTLVVELVASWFIVLIFTGIYIWWPVKKFSAAGFFTIRIHKGRRLFWRNIHAVAGFWLSLFMLLILAGGMPWTNIFGSQLKWVQEKTHTGYPTHWRSIKGLSSQPISQTAPLSLDAIIGIAQAQQLPGKLSIKLPVGEHGVFSIANRSLWLRDQQVLHIDQYSGDIIKQHTWTDVGILMEMRQIAMRLHQGEYGFANWLAVLLITLVFTLSTAAGLISYLVRKPKGRWGLPSVPAEFRVDGALAVGIIILALMFPTFGISLLLLWLYEYLATLLKHKKVVTTQ